MNTLENFTPARVATFKLNSQATKSNPNDYPNAETIQLLTPSNSPVFDPAINSQNQASKKSIQHLRLSLVKMEVYRPTVQIKDYALTEKRNSIKHIVITNCKTNQMNK